MIKSNTKEDAEFWLRFQHESQQLARKYPTLSATRRNDLSTGNGEWDLHGPYLAQAAFRDLAAAASERCGIRGTKNLLVNWWLDHLHGDHVKRTPIVDRDNELAGEVIATTPQGQEGWVDGQRV